ncbi:exosortase-associated EpsI family protein [Cerasicoccus maritimus]|uniref:exosortase-associated EpsI family protein n=1 Tax=Cerasicoccus maritimus TaxID=490089 RepID=UPI0028526BE6|nr:exosortase-associated EpsI family protein [Cerasicoccus maritimus]
MRKIFFILGVVIITCCILALGYTTLIYSPPKTMTGDLKEQIVSEYDGWKIEDRPLAETEAMEETVEGILNFSQAVYRTYERGSTRISVYVAYWEPKMMPVRLVQSHTPDVCWVRSGWTLIPEESGFSVPCSVEGEELFNAERRTLEKDNHTEYVAYWHVLGDQLYVNRTKPGQWDRWDPIKTLFTYGLHQQREQFFIRINSNKPIDEIWDLPLMQDILKELAELTLTPPAAPEQA